MWRDELQAWLIASTSGSPAELVHNARYEGHPLAWHSLLFLVSRVTRAPEAMQVLQGIIAALCAGIIVYRAPFGRAVRMVILAGYFILFEYAVISRGYGLGLLALLGHCALRERSPLAAAASLAVLANTSLYGTVLAGALGGHFLWVIAREGRMERTRMAACALIGASGIAVAVMTMIPPGGFHSAVGPLAFGWDRVLKSLEAAALAFVPIPDPRAGFEWNSSLVFGWALSSPGPARALLGVLALATAGWSLRADRPLSWTFVAGAVGLLGAQYLVDRTALRHVGGLFMLFLSCLWLLADARRPRARTGRAAFAILIIQAIAGVVAFVPDFYRPFSNTSALADWIRRTYPSAPPVAGVPDFAVSPLSAYLHAPVFLPESGRGAMFVEWSPERTTPLTAERFRDRISRFVTASDGNGLLVMSVDRSSELAGLRPRKVAEFGGAIVRDENFVVYEIGSVDP